jgi:hypothetical protein
MTVSSSKVSSVAPTGTPPRWRSGPARSFHPRQFLDPRHRRPLVVVAALGGSAAALMPILVLSALGVIGWFVSDAGVHGEPRDGLRIAAIAWLAAHGADVQIQGATITMLPLGITILCAWVLWRMGYRVGDSVSGHGPDAEGIVNGERDLIVPTATVVLTASYVVVTVFASVLSATSAAGPSPMAAIGGAMVLAVGFGGVGIAVGSGRAAIWMALVPIGVRAVLAGASRIVGLYVLASRRHDRFATSSR